MAIPGLEDLADGPVLTVEDHRRFLANGWLWIAERHRRVAGFLCAELLDGELHVRELSVHRAAQGRGIGRLLLDAAIDGARRAGLGSVTLTTFRAVPWNAPFYQRYGFRLLEPADCGPQLAATLAGQEAHGMPPGSRCAMRHILA